MKFIWHFYWIHKRKVHLVKMNNLPKHHGTGPQSRGAQCSCIGCIGLRPVLGGMLWIYSGTPSTTAPLSRLLYLCLPYANALPFASVTRPHRYPACGHSPTVTILPIEHRATRPPSSIGILKLENWQLASSNLLLLGYITLFWNIVDTGVQAWVQAQ